MLDFASNAVVYWQIETIKNFFDVNCEKNQVDPNEAIVSFLDVEFDEYRIVEFLNEQLDPAEMLAVEIKQYGFT